MDLLKEGMSKGLKYPSPEWFYNADNYRIWSRLDGFWRGGSIHRLRCKYVQEKGLYAAFDMYVKIHVPI